jgi:hypothetical protein
MRRYYRSPEATQILIRARLVELRKLAAKTTNAFDQARLLTGLSRREIALRMLAAVNERRGS